MLKIELKNSNGSIIRLEDPERSITKVILNIEVSESDVNYYNGMPLNYDQVNELIAALKAI